MKLRALKIILLLLFLMAGLVDMVFAKSKIKDYDYGIGIGIPYGGLGGNVEIGRDYLFTVGLGLVPFTDASTKNTQMGWSTGLRFYIKKSLDKSLRWRVSLLYGTVGYTERVTTNTVTGGTTNEYNLQTGFAPAVGLRGENWDLDLAYAIFDVPDNETRKSGTIMFSFGLRF